MQALELQEDLHPLRERAARDVVHGRAFGVAHDGLLCGGRQDAGPDRRVKGGKGSDPARALAPDGRRACRQQRLDGLWT